ncbi:MAG: hypothetical protein QME62_06475 [Armatimonadota bacterium]|nr:hypothetical protein [Armatimonadota bacterium]
MESQILPIALFVLLIAISAGMATWGLSRSRYFFVGLALFIGILGAVLLAVLTHISIRTAGTAFAVIFTILGLMITFDGIKKHTREVWLQGLAQFFIGGALIAYTKSPNLLKGIGSEVIAVNLPWFIVGVLLIVLAVKTSKRK